MLVDFWSSCSSLFIEKWHHVPITNDPEDVKLIENMTQGLLPGPIYKHVGPCAYICTGSDVNVNAITRYIHLTTPLNNDLGNLVIQKHFTNQELLTIINLFKHFSDLIRFNGKNVRWNKTIERDWHNYLDSFDSEMQEAINRNDSNDGTSKFNVLIDELAFNRQYSALLRELIKIIPEQRTLSANKLIPLLQQWNKDYVQKRLEAFEKGHRA